MSSKRRRQDDDTAGDKRQSRRRRKHLYLVLDDWDNGFSIHKIDADTFDSDSDHDHHHSGAALHHLPDPPALRLEPPVSLIPDPGTDMPAARCMHQHQTDTDMSFAALGTKILAFTNHRSGGTLVYDAGTAVLSAAAAAPAQMARVGCRGFSLAAGDALYALTYRHADRQRPHSFHAMLRAPTAAAADDAIRPPWRQHPTEGWAWKALPPPPISSWVHSHALHPDGRTIFVTSPDEKGRMGTCSFDAAAGMDSGWRYHGNWVLPFHGEGHYDGELGAWVGLHRDGYVCCCQPVSPGFVSTAPCFYVDCKVTKDKMFSKKHMRVSLTSMGDGKFCLVECVAAEKEKRWRPVYGERDGCVIHLTVFGLKYDRNGELQVKDDDRSTRSFLVSRHRPHFAPRAFWM